MKYLFQAITILMIVSCSQKYTASFQNYDRSYEISNKHVISENELLSPIKETQHISVINAESGELAIASTKNLPADISISQTQIIANELKSISKQERKSLIKQIRSESKSFQQEPKVERKGNPKLNFFAVSSGFLILGGIILGFSLDAGVFGILALLGFLFGILGLWSQRKVWAIGGLAIALILSILALIALSSFE